MMKGIPVDELIVRFFGTLAQWPVAPDGHNFTQAQIKAVCEHIHATGDCLWHAQHVVIGGTCHCAQCVPAQAANLQTVYVAARPKQRRPR